MRIFEKDGKINFVDDQNAFVGFDNESSCCESFGHIISREIPIKADTESLVIDLAPYQFDPAFFQKETVIEEYRDDGDGSVSFRLVNKDNPEDVIFLSLFNHHNGYYGHGFEFSVNGEKVQEDTL